MQWNQPGQRRVSSGVTTNVPVGIEPQQPELTFDDFYARAWPMAFKFASILVQDSSVGEELAQEALTKMYPTWGRYERPEAYLRTVIANGSKNWHRHNQVVRTKLPLLAGPGHHDPVADELADAIAALPYRQRAVLVMRYYADMTEAEMAEALECRPGTVKSLASRALAALAKEIDQ